MTSVQDTKLGAKQALARHASSRSRVLGLVRERIVSGSIAPGGRIPDRRSLAQEFAVSTFTVHRALERLEADGFIESRGRQGTFVCPMPPHLFHYGLIFSLAPDANKPWSRYWSGLANEADVINGGGRRKISVFYGIDGHRDTESYRRLVSEVRRQCLAGLVFSNSPPAALVGTPVMSQPNLPRVALAPMRSSPAMPGLIGVGPEPLVFLRRAFDEAAAAGRKRVAILTTWRDAEELLSIALPWATQRGLELLRQWVQQVDARSLGWAAQVVELLFDRPGDQQPEALIIDDDNLVEPATAGLLRVSGGAASDKVLVIHHCNFPYPPHSLVPSVRIGFDLRRWLATGLDCIDRLRRGERALAIPPILPVREDELASNTPSSASSDAYAQAPISISPEEN